MTRLTEEEFERIVNEAAASEYRIDQVSIRGFQATLTFRSRSGRGAVTWDAQISCDPETGDCEGFTGPYGSQRPGIVMNQIANAVQLAVSG